MNSVAAAEKIIIIIWTIYEPYGTIVTTTPAHTHTFYPPLTEYFHPSDKRKNQKEGKERKKKKKKKRK